LAGVQREAAALREIARNLVPVVAHREFTRDDMRALFEGQIALGTSADDWQFSHGEQITMALEAIVTNLASAGYLEGGHADAMTDALAGLYKSFGDEQNSAPTPLPRR